MNTTTNNTSSNSNAASTYSEKAAAIRNRAAERRYNDLNNVSNAARKAFPGLKTNAAIARYCGYQLEDLRSYRQCVDMGLDNDTIHTLPTLDVWGSNSEEYSARTGAPRFFPRAAFVVADLVKVDSHDPAADIPAEPMDNTATAPTSDLLHVTDRAEMIADAFFSHDTPAPAEPVTMTADDLPF